LQQKTYLFLP
jgi:hypothetical protein